MSSNIIKSIEIKKDGILWDLYTESNLDLWRSLTTREDKEKIRLRDSRAFLKSLKRKK